MPAEPSHICAQPLLDPMKTRITATAAAASACYSELPLVIRVQDKVFLKF
jgi:hypothetical protein